MDAASGSHPVLGETPVGDGCAVPTVLRFSGARLSDRVGERHLPIGDDGFERAMERSVVVDKSMLVADVVNGGLVTLFCRPRRFGKTFNMTMLKAFFEIPLEGAFLGPNLFEGLKIWDAEGGRYRAYHRAFPVIYLSFNSIKRATWSEAHAAFAELIAAEFARHAYLESSGSLSGAECEYFSRIRSAKGTDAELANSITQLALLLRKHHGRRVVVLVDEYDTPVMAAYSSGPGYYDDVFAS